MVERLWVPSIHLFPARNWNCAIPGCPFTPSIPSHRRSLHTVDDGEHAGHVDTVTGGPGHGGFSFRSVVHDDARHPAFPPPSPPEAGERRRGKACRRPLPDSLAVGPTGSPEDPAIEPMARQYRHAGTDDRPSGPHRSARETVYPSTGVEYPVTTPGLDRGSRYPSSR